MLSAGHNCVLIVCSQLPSKVQRKTFVHGGWTPCNLQPSSRSQTLLGGGDEEQVLEGGPLCLA